MGTTKLIFPSLAVVIAIIASIIYNNTDEGALMNDQSLSIDGIAFPQQIKIAGSKQNFVGGGTRVKWMVKVYGVGIYTDPKTIKSLKKYDGVSAESLMGSSDLFDDFAASKPAKTLLLRFHREVGATDISEALGEALKPRVGDETSKSFQSFILDMVGGDKMQKGSDLFITCKGEKLWASLTGGSDAASISLKGLCSAIFQVYLGDTPVSPQAKEGFAKGFSELVAAKK